MGFFSLLKKSKEDNQDDVNEDITEWINSIACAPDPKPLTNEEYTTMRDSEEEWFENHYDFNSIAGIKRIPLKKGLRCPTTQGVTGYLYYYLRRKAYTHEKEGKMDLAVACMSKSSELAMLDYGSSIQKTELYPLVKILARNGQVEEAIAEKEFVDSYCEEQQNIRDRELFSTAIKDAQRERTDFLLMSVHSATCPECAKYQGRVYSISGKSKKFPKLPDFFFETGRVHSGCGHTFSCYIDGVDSPMLDYTLEVHPLKNKFYGRNIVAFSNRPFVDDRTKSAKERADAYNAERAAQDAQQQENEDNMIEYEAQRGNDARNYFWIKENIPKKCPKSLSGYRRMKTQNTKNYQILKQMAAELGREI